MPNRPKPGERRGRTGADLTPLIVALFGGVEGDPSFASASDMESLDLLGGEELMGVALKGGGQFQSARPYKGRTFLGKGEAARLNADYAVDQANAGAEVARQLQLESGRNPILAQRTRLIGDVENTQKLQQEEALAKLKLGLMPQEQALAQDNERVLQAIRVLGNKGILPTKSNEASYDTKATGALLAEIVSGADAATRENLLKDLRANTSLTAEQRPEHVAAILGKTLADAQTAAEISQRRKEAVPQTFGAELASALQEPLLREADLRRRSILEAPTNGLFNINSRKFELNPAATDLEKIQNAASGIPTPSRIPQQNILPVGDITADDLIIDPVTKRILGVKPRNP